MIVLFLQQGTDFQYLPREGFGWTNASYQVGLEFITQFQRRALGTLTSPESFFYGKKAGQIVPAAGAEGLGA